MLMFFFNGLMTFHKPTVFSQAALDVLFGLRWPQNLSQNNPRCFQSMRLHKTHTGHLQAALHC